MIIDYSEQLKNKILQNNNESRFTILKEKLLNYPMEAWRLIKYSQEFQMYQDQPFLHLIDYSEFENTLSQFSNSTFNDFIDFCTARYQHGFKDFEKENGFFENLKKHLEKYLKENKIPPLRRWLTNDLLQRVNTLLKPE